MLIHVYLDNNVWDFLYEHKLNLAVELPAEEFRLFLTREAEFEIPPIKSDTLKAFIDSTIQSCSVQTDSLFGFYDDSLPQSEQRVAGWGEGRWASKEELEFIIQQKAPLAQAKKRKTGLYKNEADVSLAARSFHSVVLSLDKKSGPINSAYRQGGKVLFLNDFAPNKMSLKGFIQAAVRAKAIHEAGHAVMAIEMGFELEYVTLAHAFGDSGRAVDGLCSYNWRKQHHRNPRSCARGRAMTVFAGVLAECAIFGQGNSWEWFAQQKDDIDKLDEILNGCGPWCQADADRWQLDLWNRCKLRVGRKQRQILRVAEALCEKGFLSGNEVRALLAESQAFPSRYTLILALAGLFFVTCIVIAKSRQDAK